jgi:hypothetical protein
VIVRRPQDAGDGEGELGCKKSRRPKGPGEAADPVGNGWRTSHRSTIAFSQKDIDQSNECF